jgi:RHS repeat-associated protein
VESLKFTGKERDAETGLDYFGARYFSGAQGRWTSPDWSARPEPVPYAKLDDPQTLNLYGYLSNNPVATTDPDGHGFWGDLRDNAADFVNGVARGAAASATVGTMPGSGPSSSDTVLNRVGQAVGSGIVGYIGTTAAQVGGAGAVLTSPTAIGAVAGSAVAATGVLAVGGAIKNLGAIITTPMQMGALDKSPKGPGTVPKDQRAPQRVATPGQKEDMRANQGGTCANCGQSVKEGEGIGHHYPERHADGGKDMVLVCKDCHVNELHK